MSSDGEDTTSAPALLGLSISLQLVTAGLVGARITTRIRSGKTLQWHDWAILMAEVRMVLHFSWERIANKSATLFSAAHLYHQRNCSWLWETAALRRAARHHRSHAQCIHGASHLVLEHHTRQNQRRMPPTIAKAHLTELDHLLLHNDVNPTQLSCPHYGYAIPGLQPSLRVLGSQSPAPC